MLILFLLIQVTIDGTNIYTGTLNISGLLDWNYNAYVGFSGGVAAGYMNQYVTEWSLTATPGKLKLDLTLSSSDLVSTSR